MSTQRRSPPEVSHSLEQQMGSNDNTTDTISKPFSIRDFVLAARQKDICHNWPFPEEYLQVCVKHGIDRVLPPFESHDSVRNPSYKEDVGSINMLCAEIGGENEIVEVGSDVCIDEALSEVSKRVCLLSLSANGSEHGEDSGPNSNIMASTVHISTTKPSINYHVEQFLVAMPSTKRLSYKRKKRKGKPKKRSMVDICAKARPCTLEDLDKINGSNWAIHPSVLPYVGDRGAIKSENIVDEVTDGFRKMKHPRDDNVDNGNVLGKKRRTRKIKLNGCRSKSQNRRVSSLRTDESKFHEISIAKSQAKCSATTESEFQPAENPQISGWPWPKASVIPRKDSGHSKRMELNITDRKCLQDHNNSPRHLEVMSDRNSSPKHRRREIRSASQPCSQKETTRAQSDIARERTSSIGDVSEGMTGESDDGDQIAGCDKPLDINLRPT